jgi:hypothetical protein
MVEQQTLKTGTKICIAISFMFIIFFSMMLVYLPVPITKNMEKQINSLVLIK